jgi:tetratricopeptide (TPR) repeat protein
MKRLLIVPAVIALAVFVFIAALRRTQDGGATGVAGVENAEHRRVRDFWATFNRASTLRTQGDFAAAVELYRQSAMLNPRHEDSLYYLGTCLQELGEYAEAARVLRQLIALNPSSSRAHSQLGNTLATLAPGAVPDFPAARQEFLRSAEINREEAGPFLRLGLLEVNQGKLTDALEHFRIAAGMGSPEGLFGAGYTCYLLGRDDDAARFFTQALEIYLRERRVAARGVLSEGDVLPAPGKPLTALERVGLKSLLLLYWTSRRHGGYSAQTPKELRIQPVAARSSHQTGEVIPALHFVSLPGTGGRGAWGDFDGDGAPDLVVAGRSVKLYRNEDGRLADSTAAAGFAGVRDAWDAVAVDLDGNGSLDLYVIRPGYMGEGQNQLFANSGHGRFTDVTAKAGLMGTRSTSRACFADLDGDGHPDLVEVGARTSQHAAVRLYRNTGNRFVEQTASGLAGRSTAVDCAVGDFNGDGKPDLFVLYWKSPAILYANRGNGRFEDVTAAAGVSGVGGQSFSAVFSDFDKDGQLDLLVSTQAPLEEVARSILQPEDQSSRHGPRLFRNTGGKFAEVTEAVGFHHAYGTMQALVADFDRDGWMDVLLVNGGLEAMRLEPSVVLRNVEGKRFEEWSHFPAFDQPANLLGAALAHDERNGRIVLIPVLNPLTARSALARGRPAE